MQAFLTIELWSGYDPVSKKHVRIKVSIKNLFVCMAAMYKYNSYTMLVDKILQLKG